MDLLPNKVINCITPVYIVYVDQLFMILNIIIS